MAAGMVALFSWRSGGQKQAGWRISPEKINIQAGTSRTLQILDENAGELRGALWSIDHPDRAEIREENGRATMYAKVPGAVLVSASIAGQTRTMQVQIWPCRTGRFRMESQPGACIPSDVKSEICPPCRAADRLTCSRWSRPRPAKRFCAV
jgi:hypothetical protein